MKKLNYHKIVSPGSSIGYGGIFFLCMTALNYALERDIELYIQTYNTSYSLNINNWEVVFEQPFDIKKKDVNSLEKCTDWDLGPPLYSYGGDDRKRFQDINFVTSQRKIIKKYAKPKTEFINKVKEFLNPYKGKKILGIHRRGRDHFTSGHASGQGNKINEKYIKSIVDKYIDNYDYLFVTSDEKETYESLNCLYPGKVIFFDNKEKFKNNDVGIHSLNLSEEEKIEVIKSLMMEVFILSKCDRMLLMNSNVSHMALFFSETKDYEFYDNHVNYR